ncbi:hypothetical protein OOU_Y34scaffold00252g3 [Pyricularia oryzae Y34]|uniref:Uncharacterized protein n=1 Tax=Pyricularia oryzae (strain Y34) TaxID=1143189 RepID=A0AA97P4G5_PYRO3|nr:hypothetical protein OOU_Y34scaffold00252g3 [Pyricularia oryzae Y34]
MVEGCQAIARDASLPDTPPASASGCSHRDSPHLSPGSDPGCCCIAICGARSWLVWIDAGRESRLGDVTQNWASVLQILLETAETKGTSYVAPAAATSATTAQVPQGSQGQEIKAMMSDINEVRTMIGGLTNQLQGVLDIVRKVEQSQERLEQNQETFKQMQEKMKQGLTELTESFEIHDVEVAQDQGATELGFLSGSSLFRETTSI